MSIGLSGDSQSRPTAQFKLQFNGSVLPGYCQNLDDPLLQRLTLREIPGRDAQAPELNGIESRTITANMRILTRLGHATGRAHLDDCLEQYREALAIVARADSDADLYLGDSDRSLRAAWRGASAPLAAPDHQAINYNLTFQSGAWYSALSPTTAERDNISTTRLSGTMSGTGTFQSAHFAGTEGFLSDAAGEYIAMVPSGSLKATEGSIVAWIRPQFSSSAAPTDHVIMRVSGATDWFDIRWADTPARFVVSGNGSNGGARLYATAPAVTFVSGAHLLVAATWDNTGTRIYVGEDGGSLVTSSSALAPFTYVETPTLFHLGGTTGMMSNSVLSDVLTFKTSLTSGSITHLFESNTVYDPMDTDLPATMLLDHRLNGTGVAHSNSNNIYFDLGDTRRTYPVVTIAGSGSLVLSGTAGRVISYAGTASPAVEVDCATLRVLNVSGTNKVSEMQNINFGVFFSGSQRVALSTTAVSGSFNVDVSVTPRYER